MNSIHHAVCGGGEMMKKITIWLRPLTFNLPFPITVCHSSSHSATLRNQYYTHHNTSKQWR